MLQPHELAAAMGFDGYEFAGTKTDQVRQIGNAVAVRTAEALCGAMIDAGHAPRQVTTRSGDNLDAVLASE
jgi:DNA (cytosine-5)-methyltransferase 1